MRHKTELASVRGAVIAAEREFRATRRQNSSANPSAWPNVP